MMQEIGLAAAKDVESVGKLYDHVNDYLSKNTNYCSPNWQKGKYPAISDAQNAFEKHNLFVLKINQTVVGSMIIDKQQHPEYKKIPWTLQVPDDRVMVLHTVVVDPDYRKKGLGENLIRYGIEFCKSAKAKTIRLDTYFKNIPARCLYRKCGFQSLGCQKAVSDGIIQEFDVFEYNF